MRLTQAVILLSVVLAGCGLARSPGITARELQQQITDGRAPIIVDVRSEGEFTSGHIGGAIHIPFYEIASRHREIGAGPHERIVVYCAHGPRALLARSALLKANYDNVIYLEGHMSGWQREGLPVE